MSSIRPIVAAVAFMMASGLTCAGIESGDSSGAGDGSGAETTVGRGPLLSSALYQLSWDTQGATWSEAEAAWLIETNLGYQVRLDSGLVTSFAVSLVACSDVLASTEPSSSPGVMARLFGPSTAYAGHGDVADPSATPSPVIESLELEAAQAVQVDFEAQEYCRAHYLIARARSDSLGIDEAPDMEGVSLRLSIAYRGAGDAAWQALDLETTSGNGRLFELDEHLGADEAADWQGQTDAQTAVLVLNRRMSSLFDDIDFDAAVTETDASRQILSNLVERMDLEVTFE